MQATLVVSGIPRVGKATIPKELGAREDIMFDLDCLRSAASACSVLTGAPVRIIRNEEGEQAGTAGELLETIVKRLG